MLTKEMLARYMRETKHALFGPSSMKRRVVCSGSAYEEANAPIPPTSEFAARGTELHDYCEKAYNEMPDNPVRWINESDLDEEGKVLCIEALEYVETVRALHVNPRMSFEHNGSLESWGIPDVQGTCDVVIVSDTRIDVLDYKFGRGVQVFAEHNLQCACYLASAINFPGDDVVVATDHMPTMVVHIVQPTLNHFDYWILDWTKLCKIILGEVNDAIRACYGDDPSYCANMETCRFCNVRNGCKHRIKDIGKKVALVRETRMQLAEDPALINKDQWRRFLNAADDIQQAIKDGRAYAHAEIESGRGFPGYKLVAGRSNRAFKDKAKGEKFIQEKLGDKAFTKPKLISLAQAEKVLPGLKKMDKWKGMITKPTGKPVLVNENDSRSALEFTMQNEFDQLAEAHVEVDEYRKENPQITKAVDDMFK